jgi:hypothetical protein
MHSDMKPKSLRSILQRLDRSDKAIGKLDRTVYLVRIALIVSLFLNIVSLYRSFR